MHNYYSKLQPFINLEEISSNGDQSSRDGEERSSAVDGLILLSDGNALSIGIGINHGGGISHDGSSGGEGSIDVNDVIDGSVSINISDLSILDLSAVSLNADLISDSVSSDINQIDKVVRQLDGLDNLVGNFNISKVDAVGLVVLSGFSHVSNNDLSVSNSGRLDVVGIGGQNVSSNSVIGSDGVRTHDVVDDTFDDSGKGSSVKFDGSRSGDVQNPGGGEFASRCQVPGGGLKDSSVDLDVVQVLLGVASQQKSSGVDR